MIQPFRRFLAMIVGGACLATAACTHGDEQASLERSIAVPRAPDKHMMALAPDRERQMPAIASLPEDAGAVQVVRTHDYVNGLRQDILLKGGASRTIQNSLTILARTDRRETLDEQVPLSKPTEAAIRSEIGGQFPHVAMSVVERDSHNTYGPYGLALGRAGGDVRCLYMWQWIDANRLPPDAGVMGPVSVRLRLCQAGTSFDAMASIADRLVIGGPASEHVAEVDGIAVIEAPVAAPLVEAPIPRKPIHKRRVAVVHHHARVAKRERPKPTEVAEEPASERFMSAAPTTPRTLPRPAPDQTAALASSKMSSDLPPQAYLGPKAAKAY